jgi:hypothetical protein
MPIQQVIPAYVYSQYADDEDIQAFNTAFNILAQRYVDFFNSIDLPIYTKQNGSLLDWVGQGIYGIARPVLSSGMSRSIGAYGTFAYGTLTYDGSKIITPGTFFLTTDAVYQAIMTWALYKGDGKNFCIQWLKRRVARFLYGPGFDVALLYGISVTFGANYQVNINILNGLVSDITGAQYGGMLYGAQTYGALKALFTPQKAPPLAPILAEAIAAGVLELPFQFTWVVNIGVP